MMLGVSMSAGSAPAPAQAGGPPFSSDLVAFFDADDDTSFVLDGASVVSWSSKVGNVVAAPHAPEYRPARTPGAVNGRAAVIGETGKFLPFVDATSLPTSSMSVFFVAGSVDDGYGYGPGWGESQNVAGEDHFNINGGLAEGTLFLCLETPGGGSCAEIPKSENAPGIVSLIFSAAVGAGQDTIRAYADGDPLPGDPFDSTTIGYPSNVGGITWYGADPGDNDGWAGPICELLVYGRALSNEERVQVESYLSDRWGLT